MSSKWQEFLEALDADVWSDVWDQDPEDAPTEAHIAAVQRSLDGLGEHQEDSRAALERMVEFPYWDNWIDCAALLDEDTQYELVWYLEED